MAPGYTAINVSFPAREDLRAFQAVAVGALGRRVNMSDALRLAVHIAKLHLSSDVANAWQALTTESNGETR